MAEEDVVQSGGIDAIGLHPVENEGNIFHGGISGATIGSGVPHQPRLA